LTNTRQEQRFEPRWKNKLAGDSESDDASDHEGAIEYTREGNALVNQRRPVELNPICAQSHPRADDTRDRQYQQQKDEQALMAFE